MTVHIPRPPEAAGALWVCWDDESAYRWLLAALRLPAIPRISAHCHYCEFRIPTDVDPRDGYGQILSVAAAGRPILWELVGAFELLPPSKWGDIMFPYRRWPRARHPPRPPQS